MEKNALAFWLNVVGSLCWMVCFWWMHRLSSKQNALLEQLHDQGKRIEKFSKMEHDLIKEVHPKVSEIQGGLTDVLAAVNETTDGRSG